MIDKQLDEIIEKLHVTATMIADKIRYIRMYHFDDEKYQKDLDYLNVALRKVLYSKYLLLTMLSKQYDGEIPPYFAILEEVKETLNEILPEITLMVNELEEKITGKTVDISELKKIAIKDTQEAKKILLQY